jgi:hypothetical protein
VSLVEGLDGNGGSTMDRLENMHTDEYEISISREIQVCKNQIERAEKAIHDLERRFDWLASVSVTAALDVEKAGVFAQWQELKDGLLAWQQRLKEYEEAYRAIRSRKAWPNAI